jgi:urease accessory protein
MKFLKFQTVAKLAATGLLVLASSAHAHTGHDTSGLVSGLVHPLGLDHILALLAV